MATWGSQTWGYENWGTLGDQNVDLSGQSTTTSVDSVTVDGQIQIGWGGLTWGEGEWGDLTSPNIDVSGNGLTSTVNSVSIAINIDAIPTSLSLNTDTGEPFVTAPLEIGVTGEQLNSTSSTVSVETRYLIGSVEATTTVDSVDTQIDVAVELTGQGLTVAEGTVDPSPDATVTGIGLTVDLGLGTVVAGADTDITGNDLTLGLGNLNIEGTSNLDLTGQELTGSAGQLEYEVIYSLSGSEATLTAGDVFAGEVVTVQVRTASAQPWGEIAWGNGQWGQSVGTDIGIGGEEVAVPSVEVDVTGIGLSSNTGNESVTGDSNVSLTGIALDIQQGDEDAFTNVRINVTGQELGPITIGDFLAGISAEVSLTGVTGTTSTGIIGLNAWELVDPGTPPTWTVVDKAA